MASSKTGRIGSAVLWSGINTVLTRVVTLVSTAIVVRIVTPHEFGVFTLALIVFAVITGLSELGLNACMARHDLDPDEVGPSVALLGLVVSLLLAGALVAVATPLTRQLGSPDAAGPLRVLSLSIVLIGVFAVPVGLVTRNFRQDAFLIANLAGFVPSTILLIVLAAHGHGAYAFAWSRVVGHVVTGLVLVAFVGWGPRPRLQPHHLRVVLGFGLPIAGAALVRYVLLNTDYLLIGRLVGVVALGIYTLAFNVGSWASAVLASVINTVAMPALSQESGNPAGLARAYRNAVTVVGLVGFPIAATTSALAGPIVEVLYGPTWERATPILAILCAYGALFALITLIGNLFVAVAWSGRLFWLQVIWLALLFPAMVLGIRWHGLQGVAVAHIVVAVLLVGPAHLFLLRKRIPGVFRITVSAMVRPLLLTVPAYVVARLVASLVSPAPLQVLLAGSAAVLVYALVALPVLVPLLPERMAGPLQPVMQQYERILGRLVTRHARQAKMGPAPPEGSPRVGSREPSGRGGGSSRPEE